MVDAWIRGILDTSLKEVFENFKSFESFEHFFMGGRNYFFLIKNYCAAYSRCFVFSSLRKISNFASPRWENFNSRAITKNSIIARGGNKIHSRQKSVKYTRTYTN